MSKGAVHRLIGIVKLEHEQDGIFAYNLHPGFVTTERMIQDMGAFGFDASQGAPARRHRRRGRVAVHRARGARAQRPVDRGSGAVRRTRSPPRMELTVAREHPAVTFSLDGWNIGEADALEWAAWGSGDNARAKILATGDDYYVALVEAGPGYRSDPHRHEHTEFLYVVSGTLQNQGRTLGPGSAFVANTGSEHQDFGTTDGATYVSIFKL